MQVTLYHYVHCPFCVRVRMALGYLGISYQSQVVAYDDETTPIKLTGKKMLPIATIDGRTLNESLDIMRLLDRDDRLKIDGARIKEMDPVLTDLGETVHSLAMPEWIYTQEFTETARVYFQKKKEQKRGPFTELYRRKPEFIQEMNLKLAKIETKLTPFYESDQFSVRDIILAAHVWGLYVVPEFQFSPKWHQYLQNIKLHCRFNYHEDYWR